LDFMAAISLSVGFLIIISIYFYLKLIINTKIGFICFPNTQFAFFLVTSSLLPLAFTEKRSLFFFGKTVVSSL